KTVTMSIPDFISAQNLRWVTKFNYVRFYMVISQISEVARNPLNGKYEPLVADLELLSKVSVSDWIVRNDASVDVYLEASFDEPAFGCANTTVVVAMGVEFSNTLFMGQPYVEPHSGSLAIIGCFTE
ncbi:MAG: hypothetical protein Q8908_10315, partial [Bacteroidota bacterium]|nr:hypothetical protein [Bacteroidota bacterium]